MFWRKKEAKPTVVDDDGKPADNANQVHQGTKAPAIIENSAVIPHNHIARLMYYMHCVRNCVDIEISSRLVDFRNYHLLTEVEKRDVVAYVHRFHPRVLGNVIFFAVSDDNYLLPKSTNNFLAFDDPEVIGSFNLPSNVVSVDGVQHVIQRIMIYKYSWLHDYFETPFNEEKWRIGLSPRRVSLF